MSTDQNRRPQAGDDNVAQLKHDIDSGRTGDKVASHDPGLSPLGTDDEAGGHPATPDQIALARRQETALGAQVGDDEAHSSIVKRIGPVVLMVAVIVLFAAVILAKVFLSA